ncbi:MAG: HAMP domain-containing methyl-accepting chemotaxis protein [Candidatus Hodarchaeales archaeon]|jgi:methyl-accepting chemotaxis protein
MGIIENIKLSKKLFGSFIAITVLTAAVGAIGVVSLTNLSNIATMIHDEDWVIANNAMEVEAIVNDQVALLLDYMIDQAAESKAEFLAMQPEVETRITGLENLLGKTDHYVVEVSDEYDELLTIANGNSTVKGVFTVTDEHELAEADMIKHKNEMGSVHDDIDVLLATIEEYAGEGIYEGVYDNTTVADEAMDLNIVLYEVVEQSFNYITETDDTKLLGYKSNIIHLLNNVSNPENALNKLNDLEDAIDGAGSSIKAGTDTIFDQLKAKVTVGVGTTPSWIDIILDPDEGLLAEKDVQLAADMTMDDLMVMMDVQAGHLHITLESLAEGGDRHMNESIDSIVSESLFNMTAMVLITVVAVIVAFVIATFLSRMIVGPILSTKEDLIRMGSGDLAFTTEDMAKIQIHRGDEIGDMARAFKNSLINVRELIRSAQMAAERLLTSSEEFASSAEELNASSEEISSVIQQMNRGAQQQAEQINDTVNNVQVLSNISEKIIQDISNTVGLISDVAAQTNMLSLNAQIEAARAGDFGKSFMVVADNVRRLAEDTKASTGSIQALVEDIQHQITNNVDKIAKSVDSVAAVAEETAASSEEASASTEEQTATMEEMSAAAQELAQLAEELTSSITMFKVEKEEVAISTVAKDVIETKDPVEKSQKHVMPLVKRLTKKDNEPRTEGKDKIRKE